jgi:hypothetical protein
MKEEHEREHENAYQERKRMDLERERYQQIIQTLQKMLVDAEAT